MKQIKILALALALCSPLSALSCLAQDCEIQIAPVIDDSKCNVPASSKQLLESVLNRIVTENGVAKDITYAQFILSCQIDVIDKHVIAGPPPQYINNLGVTFYINDAYTGEKYATMYYECNGVGQSEDRSYNAALKLLKPQNAKIVNFMADAKKKILAYFDKNYPAILKEAQRKAGLKQYEEALAMVCAIPTCSKGGQAATAAGLKIYGQYRDRYARILLDQAKKIWSANPTLEGAQEAMALLQKIDPESSCQREVNAFVQTIHKQAGSDVQFETREKYKDAVALEKYRLDAIKEIGKAYGSQHNTVVVTGGLSPVVVGNTK